MTDKIHKIGPGNVSKHSSDPNKLNVIDIGPSSVGNKEKFNQALLKDKRIEKVLSPFTKNKDRAFHLEIPQN